MSLLHPGEFRVAFTDWLRANEAALAPSIEEALKMHPEVYIKSHPRGIKAGVPTLELDVTVTSRDGRTARSPRSAATRR